MVVYDVYELSFKTQKDTFRKYIGYTGNVSKREDKLKRGGADWTNCLSEVLKMRILHTDVGSKHVALALEAWEAAKAIVKDPHHVRGGPWLSVRSLGASALDEVAAAAQCRSVLELGPLAAKLGSSSRLYQHLKNLRFASASELSKATRTCASSSSNAKVTNAMRKVQMMKAMKAMKALKAMKAMKATSQASKPNLDLKPYIRAKRSRTRSSSETGHEYRKKHKLSGKKFDKHKYGKKGTTKEGVKAVRRKHWDTFVAKNK
jgi:hypothetical protein